MSTADTTKITLYKVENKKKNDDILITVIKNIIILYSVTNTKVVDAIFTK